MNILLSPRLTLLGAVFSGFCLVSTAPAAVLLGFNFGVAPAAGTDTATTVATNVGGATLVIGGGGTAFGIVGDSTGNGWSSAAATNTPPAAAAPNARFIRTVNLDTTESGAVTNNDYFEFTLSPDPGYSASLSGLTFDIASTSVFNITNVASWFLRSDLDLYATTIDSIKTVSHFSTGTSNFVRVTVDLSASPFQDLTGDTTFRLYTFSSQIGSSVNRIDNLTLNGEIAVVPEPATSVALLLGLGLGAVLVRRRR